MLKLSTKGEYGTRLMLSLARHYLSGKMVTILKDIAEEEDISFRYLEQIILPLKINRLVKSARGARGGYSLSKPPSEIKLSEILHILEGSFSLIECVEDPEYCHRIPSCVAHRVWKKASQMLNDYFESLTLHDLITCSAEKKLSL